MSSNCSERGPNTTAIAVRRARRVPPRSGDRPVCRGAPANRRAGGSTRSRAPNATSAHGASGRSAGRTGCRPRGVGRRALIVEQSGLRQLGATGCHRRSRQPPRGPAVRFRRRRESPRQRARWARCRRRSRGSLPPKGATRSRTATADCEPVASIAIGWLTRRYPASRDLDSSSRSRAVRQPVLLSDGVLDRPAAGTRRRRRRRPSPTYFWRSLNTGSDSTHTTMNSPGRTAAALDRADQTLIVQVTVAEVEPDDGVARELRLAQRVVIDVVTR